MSDNDQQPQTPQLTRRQLRELRNTASNPIIVDPASAPEAPTAEVEQPVVSAPLPRAAEPIEVPPAPLPDASVDLGAPALTRRQARLQEKIRTASIPVITPTGEHATHPDVDAALPTADEAPVDTGTESETPTHDGDADVAADESAPESGDAPDEAEPRDDGESREDGESRGEAEPHAELGSEIADAAETEIEAVEDAHDSDRADAHADVEDAAVEDAASEIATDETAAADGGAEVVDEERHVVSEDLGADLLAGDAAATEVPASFDQLLSRSAAATGAFTTPNALILTQTPDGGPLVAPVTATGEVLITGTFALPENFGSTGVVPGVADGKEADAVLIDGELPASSSPTPIAASAAISTIKSAEDVIRPPAPEKGTRWTFALAITAGVLALALAGVLLVTLFTGVIG